MITKTNKISYNCPRKNRIRNIILLKARDIITKRQSEGSDKSIFVDLYGDGASFRKAKKLGIKIISIDDGTNYKDKNKIKAQLKGKDRAFISLRKLCQTRTEDITTPFLFLDFCGALSEEVFRCFNAMPLIMEDKGCFYITLIRQQENQFPRGTAKILIQKLSISEIKDCFRKLHFKLTLVDTFEYTNAPKYEERKKTSPTKMIVYGFDWEKKIKKQ
jgi:hypothetical protein